MENLEVLDEEIKLGQVHFFKHKISCTTNELKEILGEPSKEKIKGVNSRWNLKHEGVLTVVDDLGMVPHKGDVKSLFNILSENMVHADMFYEILNKELEFIRLPKDSFIMDGF